MILWIQFIFGRTDDIFISEVICNKSGVWETEHPHCKRIQEVCFSKYRNKDRMVSKEKIIRFDLIE